MKVDRKEISLEDFNGYLEFIENDVIINIKGNVKIYELIKSKDLNLTINLNDDSTLFYYRFGTNIGNNTNIKIKQNSNTNLQFKEAFIASKNTNLKIENNIVGDDNTSDIVLRANQDGNAKVYIDATAIVKENTENNELKEDLRGLELNDNTITIIPNLKISSSEVIANHNTTIGNVSDDNLFYLTSKGLDKTNAIKLLKEAFLIGEFKESDFKDKIIELLNK